MYKKTYFIGIAAILILAYVIWSQYNLHYYKTRFKHLIQDFPDKITKDTVCPLQHFEVTMLYTISSIVKN